MNIQKIFRISFLAFMMVMPVSQVQADEVKETRMLIYIHPQEYTHQIKLWHYYYDYWFSQGPVVEPLAKDLLGAAYGEVSMCEGNQSGKVLVWLQPRMYYNPQLQVYYGKITANVYSGIGKHLGSYVGESKKYGFLDVYPEKQVKAAYQAALQNAIAKMKSDQTLQSVIDNPAPSSATDTPCSMVTLLPGPGIRFMSF